MKIAIPVDHNTVESSVCISFGRTPYFMVYDVETKQATFLDNSVVAASQGGAGIKAAQAIVDDQATVVVTPRCGQNAADVLERAGITLYRTKNGSAMENIEAYINGELQPLMDIHAGFHRHGGR